MSIGPFVLTLQGGLGETGGAFFDLATCAHGSAELRLTKKAVIAIRKPVTVGPEHPLIVLISWRGIAISKGPLEFSSKTTLAKGDKVHLQDFSWSLHDDGLEAEMQS